MMNSGMYKLNLKDFGKGAVSAVFAAVVVSLLGYFNQGDINPFTADWAYVGNLAISAAFSAFVGYVGKNFLSTSDGKFLGRIG